MRFADEPPPVRLPAKPRQPIASASHPTTTRSMVTAAGAERQAVTFWFRTLARRSASAATGSPEPRTYPKNRGLGGRDSSTTRPSASSAAGPRPSSGSGTSNAPLTSAPEVSGNALAAGRSARRRAASSTTRSARARNSSSVSGSRSPILPSGDRSGEQRGVAGATELPCSAFLEQELQLPDPPGDAVPLHRPVDLGEQLPARALLHRGQVLQLDLQRVAGRHEVRDHRPDVVLGGLLTPRGQGPELGAHQHRLDVRAG